MVGWAKKTYTRDNEPTISCINQDKNIADINEVSIIFASSSLTFLFYWPRLDGVEMFWTGLETTVFVCFNIFYFLPFFFQSFFFEFLIHVAFLSFLCSVEKKNDVERNERKWNERERNEIKALKGTRSYSLILVSNFIIWRWCCFRILSVVLSANVPSFVILSTIFSCLR